MCHDAVRKVRAKEPKHMQDHNVFEVLWLSEVKSLSKVQSKWLQDMKRRCSWHKMSVDRELGGWSFSWMVDSPVLRFCDSGKSEKL